uniref:Centrosomal protein of 44 kDa n=1 Tax=Albugo laibachii Nc14 TaxID=890382 RepID=F0W8C2_9STRA|nr:conserved hypothetical protein [Albugo laibachii Nc14]|eukprot:CCA17377.1 conserved hypothetical protein [Albugo laibachii Nc14]
MTDLRHYATRLRKILRKMQYAKWYSVRLESGNVEDLLQCLHYGFLDYSFRVTNLLTTMKYELCGKTDARFLESCFRFLRNECNYFPTLTVAQFVSDQFLLKKLELVGDVLTILKTKHEEMQEAKARNEAKWTDMNRRSSTSAQMVNCLTPSISSSTIQMAEEFNRQKARQSSERSGTIGRGRNLTNANSGHCDDSCSSARKLPESSIRTKSTKANPFDDDVLVVNLKRQLSQITAAVNDRLGDIEHRLDILEMSCSKTAKSDT